jgi:hypothetical protein
MKYLVILTKREQYEIEADSMEDAENKALDMNDADPYAWLDPCDEIEVQKL